MRKALLAMCLCCLLWAGGHQPAAHAQEQSLRALLVGAEHFAGHPDTAPAATNNLSHLLRALRRDMRGYKTIHTNLNQRMDADVFSRAVQSAFQGAREQDISLLYITTHGVYHEGEDPMAFAVVLSDGEEDYELSAREMHTALKDVPGTKVIILDTCNSGALIDRGMPGNGLRSLFTGPDYQILTASGGSEPSFYWTTGSGAVQGGSYFADALLRGLTESDRYAADFNRDGSITLGELHTHMLQAYGASVPHAYPLESDFVVFKYRPLSIAEPAALISGVVFEQDVLSRKENVLDFSYTLSQRIRVVYQLVYHQDNDWAFHNAQYLNDAEVKTGEMLPGRKHRTLRIDPPDNEMSGYALMFLTTVEEDRSTPHAMKVLMVEPGEGNPKLKVELPKAFQPNAGEELPIWVRHAFPIRLSAHIVDAKGNRVRTLESGQPTRPQHLPEGGSLLYWNGRLRDGTLAQAGTYYITVECQVGNQRFAAQSSAFVLR